MLLALGNIDLNPLIDAMIAMAKDETNNHELNIEAGKGSWKHEDGWGIAYLQNEEWVIKKSTKAIFNDPEINNLRNLKTRLAIIHIRKKMGSETSIVNTHPFIIQKGEPKCYVFCHNGFIDEEIDFDKQFTLMGETDSEKLFYSILTDLKKEKLSKAIRKNFSRYKKVTGTNIFLSTKENTVIAIRENNFPEYYRMQIGKRDDLIVISSELIPQLSDLEWKPTVPGEIITVKHKNLKIKYHEN